MHHDFISVISDVCTLPAEGYDLASETTGLLLCIRTRASRYLETEVPRQSTKLKRASVSFKAHEKKSMMLNLVVVSGIGGLAGS